MDQHFRYKTAIVRGIAQTLSSDALKMDPNAPVLNQEKAMEQSKVYVDILKQVQIGKCLAALFVSVITFCRL